MKQNFWQKLPKPFFALAPMDDVTDVVFREVVTWTARPDVFFTEFTNVEGLNSKGVDKLLPRFKFTENQRPIVAQIWGMEPENYFKTAQMLAQMGFDGIDINMGCPVGKVVKRGACSGLIHNPTLAKQIITATKKGAPGLPISVKTRCGTIEWKTEEWIGFLLKQDLVAITIHGRIAKEMTKYPARWDEIKKAVDLRNRLKSKTLIIGNGDVVDFTDGLQKAKQSGVDGLMIGRGIFHNLWAFEKEPVKRVTQVGGLPIARSKGEHEREAQPEAGPSKMTFQHSEKFMLDLLLRHARLFDQVWGKTKNFAILRRYFKIYVSGFANASDLRNQLMQTSSLQEVEKIIKNYQQGRHPVEYLASGNIITAP